MPIIATSNGGGTFTPHPEGQFAATCADVHDLGMMEVTWQGKQKSQHKIDIYFFCGEFIEKDGKQIPMMVRGRFTLTLDDRGRLRAFLEAWRGKSFTPDEEKGFDVEKLITAPALIQVSHNEVGEKVYANITSIMKLPKAMDKPELPLDFVRICDREPAAVGAAASSGGSNASTYDEYDPGPSYAGDEEDPDLPF